VLRGARGACDAIFVRTTHASVGERTCPQTHAASTADYWVAVGAGPQARRPHPQPERTVGTLTLILTSARTEQQLRATPLREMGQRDGAASSSTAASRRGGAVPCAGK
jgi:hypothetical protein